MTVDVKRFRVGRKPPSARDVIDYALALVETYGVNLDGGQGSNETVGYSLHDAIGEACTRLSAAVEEPGSGRAGKDWQVPDDEGTIRHLRQEATARVNEAITATGFVSPGSGLELDKEFNDNATSPDEVIGVLTAAKEAAE